MVPPPSQSINLRTLMATLAIVTRLAARTSGLVFIASHIAEIAPGLDENPHVRLCQFSADLSNDSPVFDYLLRPGISTQRLGMTLLRQEGVLALLEKTTSGTDACCRA